MNAPLAALAAPEVQPESAQPAVSPAALEVLNRVQADCVSAPERYIAETVVPFGGE